MYSAFLERTLRSIDSLKRHIATSESIRVLIHDTAISSSLAPDAAILSSHGAPERTEWRIIDHCATVTRIYAIYEQFFHEMLAEHLGLLQRYMDFSALPEELRNAYRRGLGTILDKKDGPRYAHLDLADLVGQYGRALTKKRYVLEPLSLLMHEQNLRIPELLRLVNGFGIVNLKGWIDNHHLVQKFFDGNRNSASAEKEMEELIKYRNEAAHGSIQVDNILGAHYLFEFCDFIGVLCTMFSECVSSAGIDCLIVAGRAQAQGKITEVFSKGKILVGSLSGTFSVGDTLYLRKKNYCAARRIDSLQLNGVDHPSVTLTVPTELGIGVNFPALNNVDVATLNLSPPASSLSIKNSIKNFKAR